MKKNYTLILLLMTSLAFVLTSCSKTESDISVSTDDEGNATLKNLPLGSTVYYTLWAAETINVGTVSITKKSGIVTVTYETTGGWELQRTHFHAEYDWQEIPQTVNGNPILGQFQYFNEHDPMVSTFSRTMDEDYFGSFYIAVHAEVVNETNLEQAWAEGIEFPGNQWAMYIYYEPPWLGKPK
jgi:hypothetical protein